MEVEEFLLKHETRGIHSRRLDLTEKEQEKISVKEIIPRNPPLCLSSLMQELAA